MKPPLVLFWSRLTLIALETTAQPAPQPCSAEGSFQEAEIPKSVSQPVMITLSQYSFFSTLKRELANRSAWKTRAEARQDVFDYIEVFYNRQRRHSALSFQTPEAYEKQLRPT